MRHRTALTLGMIVKNEQYYLSKILPLIRAKFDECVAVDAESRDLTQDVLRQYDAKIITRRWNNNYSDAKNEVIRNSTGDWILILDADEAMFPDHIDRMRRMAEAGTDTMYEMPRLEIVGDYRHCDRRFYPDYQGRLFKTGMGYHFRNNIHEILYKNDERKSAWEMGYARRQDDYPIYHYGQCRPQWLLDVKRYNYIRATKGLPPVHRIPEGESCHVDLVSEPYDGPHPLSGLSDAYIKAVEYAKVIEGWMSIGELQWLAETASMMDVVVEVGCWKGRSTKALGTCVRKVLYAVDHFRGTASAGGEARKEATRLGPDKLLGIFSANLAREISAGKVIPVVSESYSAPQVINNMTGGQKVDMVFIDSDHDYGQIASEIARWDPLVRPGGIMSGHDYSLAFPGVTQAVGKYYGDKIRIWNSIWSVRKT